MTSLEESELSYRVIEQENRRYKIVLRWRSDAASDRVVADNLTEGAANELRDKLSLGGLTGVDIRKLHDTGAKLYRDDPNRGIIY